MKGTDEFVQGAKHLTAALKQALTI
jgi:hypothetical protein